MKLKIIIGIAIMIIIACIGAILLYFFTGNVSSKIPDNIIKECNVKADAIIDFAVTAAIDDMVVLM